MFLSIIIPAYNVESFISRCIDSCLKQNIPSKEYEIIIIDDGSPDNSGIIADAYANKNQNIRVIHKSNGGLSSARNRGIKESEGEYLWFVDSDDWIQSNTLAKLRDICISYKPDIVAFCASEIIGDKEIRVNSIVNNCNIVSGFEYLIQLILPCAPFALWNKSFLENHKLLFKEGIFHEDMEFSPRAFASANKVYLLNDILYFIYQNQNSITRTINHKKSYDYILGVCESLVNFSKDFSYQEKCIINKFIGLSINNAISNVRYMEPNIKTDFLNMLYTKKDLFIRMKNCSNWKYRIEGILLCISPRLGLRLLSHIL